MDINGFSDHFQTAKQTFVNDSWQGALEILTYNANLLRERKWTHRFNGVKTRKQKLFQFQTGQVQWTVLGQYKNNPVVH
jgi:hypothetical protein